MKELTEMLSELAAQLGVTVEYLWPHLVKNVQYEWIGQTSVAVALLLLGVTILAVTWSKFNKYYEKAAGADEQYRLWGNIIDEHRHYSYAEKGENSVLTAKGMTMEQALAERERWQRIRSSSSRMDAQFTVAFIVSGVLSIIGLISSSIMLASINMLLAPEAVALQQILGGLR
jgi:hypothetical protein